MYGSPLFRNCPSWASSAAAKARSITDRSAFAWFSFTVFTSSATSAEYVPLFENSLEKPERNALIDPVGVLSVNGLSRC
jgi:hypothetical protein